MKEAIELVLTDLNTIKNILQESSPHNQTDALVRPVDCKCGFCLMETMVCRSHIKLGQALTLLKQQPPEGDFTKKLREQYESIDVALWVTRKEAELIKDTLNKIPEACDRLDRAEAARDKLHEALTKASHEFSEYKIKRDKEVEALIKK